MNEKMLDERDRQSSMPYLCARAEGDLESRA